jgi:secreted pullulanase
MAAQSHNPRSAFLVPTVQPARPAPSLFVLGRIAFGTIAVWLISAPVPSVASESETRPDWRVVDARYAYSGELGARLHPDGSATLVLWSPLVAAVSAVLYDRDDPEHVVASDVPMRRRADGTWHVTLDATNTGVADLRGFYYHYRIAATEGGETRLALDPYARSMAPFDIARASIGKAAIVAETSALVPPLDFARIPGYRQREDAIVWEIHVRDFTVDPAIEHDLRAPFGTFEAMIDKLDYVQALGVTHVQLLPVMSFHWGDERASRTREMHWSAKDNNYNWGYDPHGWFSLSGMYSKNPDDPESRIVEFKRLVDAIHARGMGVILDVVYNHTAAVHVLEDLAPGYYHFAHADGTPKVSFGGGRLGTTRAMSRRLVVDSIRYWTREYKIDGFRFDMMGDHDAETIEAAHAAARAINPDVLFIGEGWRTFAGDDGDPRRPADQDWMAHTDAVAVFSDHFRNEVKSGYGNEGEPRFITGGARPIAELFDSIAGRPANFHADQPGDVVQYIEAHDNMTLHDLVSLGTRLDPSVPENHAEIHRRIRLGHTLLLTSQGVAFLHAGQEYGRSKQWLAPGEPEHKGTHAVDAEGRPFVHPWFVHDSFDSSDAVNRFDWSRATDATAHPVSTATVRHTAGLVALRRATDAFRLGSAERVVRDFSRIEAPEIREVDLVVAYRARASTGELFHVFVNADAVARTLTLDTDLSAAEVLVDDDEAGATPVQRPSGFRLEHGKIVMEPLSAIVLRTRS